MTHTPDPQTPHPGRLSRPARIVLVVTVLAAVVLMGMRLVQATPGTADSSSPRTDRAIGAPGLTVYEASDRDPAPPIEGRTLDDTDFALADLTGRIVVVNVWGSWCGPCRAETPELVRVALEHEDEGVRFIGIDTRDRLAAAQAFVRKFKVPYPSLFDADGRVLQPLAQLIPTAAVPSTLVVDTEGRIAARVIGRITYPTLDGLLDDLEGESR